MNAHQRRIHKRATANCRRVSWTDQQGRVKWFYAPCKRLEQRP